MTLEGVVMVTLVVERLAAVTGAYVAHLDYREVARAPVPAALAAAWDAPVMAGRMSVVLEAASGEPVWLRFIEAPEGLVPAPAFMTHGWNAVELLVEDPDRLARRLAGTPFRVIGEPADLYTTPDAPRAMQVLGPAGEVLYLTRIIPAGTRYALGSARVPVDRVFIVVAAGPSLDALRDHWGGVLGLPLGDVLHWPIGVLARAHGLDESTRFPLAVARFPRRFLVELDEYPPTAVPRPRGTGMLPGGIAMVSFMVDRIHHPALRWRAPPRPVAGMPYGGRRTAVTVGPAGEWIELIEQTMPAAHQPP